MQPSAQQTLESQSVKLIGHAAADAASLGPVLPPWNVDVSTLAIVRNSSHTLFIRLVTVDNGTMHS